MRIVNGTYPVWGRCGVLGVATLLAVSVASVAKADSWSRIATGSNRQSLTVANGKAFLGADVPWSSRQHWSLRRLDPIHVALINEQSGLALRAVEHKPSLAPFSATANGEAWTLVPVADGKDAIAMGSDHLTASNNQLTLRRGDGGSAWTITVEQPEVFIGGTHPIPWLANPANASKWQYVRTHAYGIYTSNVGIHDQMVKGPYNQPTKLNYSLLSLRMKQIAAQMTHHNFFYETDSALTLTPLWDRRVIETVHNAGWDVSDAVLWDTEGVGFPVSWRKQLQVGDANRMLHIGTGTWVLGGNFADRKWRANARVQDAMLRWNAACATEGNGTFYVPEDMQGEADLDTLIRWDKSHLPQCKTESNFSPGDLGPLGFLRQVQRCVKHCEDAGTTPDEWAITYYGPFSSIPIGPEDDSRSYLGVAQWLIEHEADPARHPAVESPYFRDDFKSLDQWSVQDSITGIAGHGKAQTSSHGNDLTLVGPVQLKCKKANWWPDHQIHFLWMDPGNSEIGIGFRTNKAGDGDYWWFSQKSLRRTVVLDGQTNTFSGARHLPSLVKGQVRDVVLELVGPTIYTYVNRRLIDETTVPMLGHPRGATIVVRKGKCAVGQLTIY